MSPQTKAAGAGRTRLRACRFCGAEAVIEPWHGGAPTKVMISCPGIVANSVMGRGEVTCEVAPHVTGETFKEAAEIWNRPSPHDQASSAMLEALEKALSVPPSQFATPSQFQSWLDLIARKAVKAARSAGIEHERSGSA